MGKKDKLVDLLKELKQEYGCLAIKAEFEAEGSRKDELIMLRELVYRADLDFIVKIGGCEAVHDLDQCKLLDATGIMAPMIETDFAMEKFKRAAFRVYADELSDLQWIINAETKTCVQNFDAILSVGKGFLTGVTVGRSDLSASMGVQREEIESDKIFNVTKELLQKSVHAGLICNFGGNIGIESVDFISNMYEVAQRFETRKVVLRMERDKGCLGKMINRALNFECEYLKFKSYYYEKMAEEDLQRIKRLENQLSKEC